MRPLRSRSVAVATALGLALTALPTVAAADPTPPPGVDLERVPERVTGMPGPVAPAPTPTPSTGRRAAGVPDATIAARLQQRSTVLDPQVGGSVVDVSSGKTIWSRNASTGLLPASNTKVLTAYSALKTFGAGHRFTTSVRQARYSRDRVFLKGSGDPTVSTYRLQSLAASTAWQLKKQGIKTVSLRVDDTLFPAPTNAKGWEAGDVPLYVAPVRALVVDQENSMDTSLHAASLFARTLKAKGITVRDTRRATTTSTSTQLASRTSPVLGTIVGDMLRDSQNDYAEALLWASGMKAGSARTWAGVTTHVEKSVEAYGVPVAGVSLEDGSGMSRSDRIPARTMSSIFAKLTVDKTYGPTFFAPKSLPVAGRTGTLENRFKTAPSSCATDLVRAKTGSLRDTTALSGIATGPDGRVLAFSFIANRRENTAAVRRVLDELAATTVTCM